MTWRTQRGAAQLLHGLPDTGREKEIQGKGEGRSGKEQRPKHEGLAPAGVVGKPCIAAWTGRAFTGAPISWVPPTPNHRPPPS